MSEAHPCPQCGEPLDVPAEMLDTAVRCGNCGRVFTPRGGPSAAEFDDAPPPRLRRRPRPTVERSSTRRTLLIVFGILGLIGLLCCGGVGYFYYVVTHPNWQDYDSNTGEFTAKFPGTTSQSTRPTGRNDEQATEITATRQLLNEEFFVYFVPLTAADGRRSPDKLLKQFADGLSSQHGGNTPVRPPFRRQHGTHEAMELCLELIDDRFLTARIVLANDKAYVVGVVTQMQPDQSPWVNQFLDAFQPKDPNAAGPKPPPGKNPFRGK